MREKREFQALIFIPILLHDKFAVFHRLDHSTIRQIPMKKIFPISAYFWENLWVKEKKVTLTFFPYESGGM